MYMSEKPNLTNKLDNVGGFPNDGRTMDPEQKLEALQFAPMASTVRSEQSKEGDGRADESKVELRPEGPDKIRPRSTEAEDDDPKAKKGSHINNVRKLRIERMMSKAELARRANLSVLTIDRVERGFGCRMDSKRKILEALGLSLADRILVFGEEE